MPSYSFAAFEQACAKGTAKVLWPALQTAPRDFGLISEADILGFIGNGGLEKPEFVNSKPWEKNPNPGVAILVDSYNFYSGRLDYGYVAFMRAPTGMWIVKSLKKNEKPPGRAFLMADQLKKAGLLK